ncbi:hypothetical protein ABEF95_000523 [Exophiala dermatitidis]
MSSSRRNSVEDAEHHTHNLVDGVAHLKNKAKEKTKKLLDATGPPAPDGYESDDNADDIFSDAAFDPAKIQQASAPRSRSSTRGSISDGVKDLKHIIAHPRRVIRNKATRVTADKLGNTNHPTLTLEQDQELLDAHDGLARATSNASSATDVDKANSEVDDAHARVQKLEQQRESLQTAWVLSRHVSRVKVVQPIPRPDRSQFEVLTEDGQKRLQWERYIGHLLLYYTQGFTAPYIDDFDSPPFDLEDLARLVERIAITSAPWQAFFVDIRNVYMWTDPKRTARWLALYSVLWYTQHLVGYLYFYIIYSTIRNRFRPSSVQTIRESVARSIDRGSRAHAWGELIQRHGKADWLEPLLDELGPMIQLQLGDLANLLEVLINFHRWERPRMTNATLFLFACCLLTSLLTDMAFCMKVVTLVAGGAFFFSYPIATRWPKYRIVLSPFRWIFWDIPTHAELAIQQLQEKALVRNADLADFEVPHPQDISDEDSMVQEQEALVDNEKRSADSRLFKVYDKQYGRGWLVVSRTGIAVQTMERQTRSWPFSELLEMRKIDDVDVDSMLKNLKHVQSRSATVLQFEFMSGDTEADKTLTVLLQPADRDRVFNLVLAWSGVRWQALMLERHNTRNDNKSDRSNLQRAIKRAIY